MNIKNGDVIRVNRGNRVIHYTGATGPNNFNGIVRETSLEELKRPYGEPEAN